MAFEIKPFKELLAMTKEKLDEAMIPLRVRAARAKADSEIIKLEEKMITLEASINELCAQKELNFNAITDKLDEYDLAERRLKQVNGICDQLFKAAEAVAK